MIRKSKRSVVDLFDEKNLPNKKQEENEFLERWREIILNFDKVERSEIKEMVYKSIPEKLREIIWVKLISLKVKNF